MLNWLNLWKKQKVSEMKLQLIVPTLVSFAIVSGCSSSSKNISCMYEKAATEWSDGSIQNQTSNLGTDTFTWFKGDGLVEVSVMRNGNMEKTKVPATLNGTDLVFSASKEGSYIINTSNGKMISTITGDSPDGKFVLKTEGTCNGFN